MIEWTIPKEDVLTGYTEQTQSSSTSYTIILERVGTGYAELYSDSGQTVFGGTSYTSHAATGSTTFWSSSSSATDTHFTLNGTDGYSGSGSSSQTQQTTSAQPSVAAQTSTTDTRQLFFESTVLTTIEGYVWTYESSSFFETETVLTIYSIANASASSTFDTTTESGTTLQGGLADTILQAEDSEVIWYYSAITNWEGLSAATNRATSATRITISPTYFTALLPKVTEQTNGTATLVLGNVSTQWSRSQSSYSINYTTALPTQETEIFVVSTHLPNLTGTRTRFCLTTETESLEVTVFESLSSSIAATDGKTQIATLAASSHKNPGTFYSGGLEWDALRTEPTVYTFTKSAPIALCQAYQSSTATSNANTTFDVDYTSSEGGASGTSSGKTIDQNYYAPLPPSCSIAIGESLQRSKFVPKAAKIGSSSGLWYEINADTTLQNVTYAMQARSALTTIFPTESQGVVTYYSDTVTFTRSTQVTGQTGSTTTTSTALLELAGGSTTTTLAPGPISAWGGYPGEGETFANVAGGSGGVYRNRIGGQTIAIEPGATTFLNSSPLSFFEPIYGIVAPLGFDEQTQASFGYWIAPRNSTALPPAMPPDA
jgi:hypothetical protein